MQKSTANNNAGIKTSIDNLQFAERNQLQQTRSYKIGGGGARAARRIQIHIRRLAETMCEASVALAIERSTACKTVLDVNETKTGQKEKRKDITNVKKTLKRRYKTLQDEQKTETKRKRSEKRLFSLEEERPPWLPTS